MTENILSTLACDAATVLKQRKERIFLIESTTGGLIGASLLSRPGASSFFIGSSVIYTARGAKNLLPPDVLVASGLMNRETNYKNKAAYIESKEKYVLNVAKMMQIKTKADWLLCESGTTGPEFYIPGVESPFTAVGVVYYDKKVNVVYEWVQLFYFDNKDREETMWDFTSASLRFLSECMAKIPVNSSL